MSKTKFRLERVIPSYWGPFYSETELKVEPGVTVLVGANDCGKSLTLELIAEILGNAKPKAVQSWVNVDRQHEFEGSWSADPEVGCRAKFVSVEGTGGLETVEVRYKMAPDVQGVEQAPVDPPLQAAKVLLGSSPTDPDLPIAVRLGRFIGMFDSELDLVRPPNGVNAFSIIAFDSPSPGEKLARLGLAARRRLLRKAEGQLEARLAAAFPSALKPQFNLEWQHDKLLVSVIDRHGGATEVRERGAGFVRLLTHAIEILAAETQWGRPIVLLADEPEEGLHADAQHRLRSLLEEAGDRPHTQVVLATHSPAMVNTLRPQTVRLLTRTSTNDRATTVISDHPVTSNWASVRTSLGVTPADALAYGPVALVVEGQTEVRGLPMAFTHLWRNQVDGFESVPEVLSSMQFVDGSGDSFSYYCKLLRSFGVEPVVFLDGDKEDRAATLRTELPGVEVLLLSRRREFEQLVPEDLYFRVLANHLGIGQSELTPDALAEWSLEKKLQPELSYTHRIEIWLAAVYHRAYSKPAVMRKVIDDAGAGDIESSDLLRLLQAISRAFERSRSEAG